MSDNPQLLAIADALRRGDQAAAGQFYQQLMAVTRDPRGTVLAVGRMLDGHGFLAEAEEQFRQALARFPKDPEVLSCLAETVRKQGNLEEAGALLKEALRRNKKAAALYQQLGLVQLARGESAEAERCFDKAAKLAPKLVAAHYNKGVACYRNSRFDAAESSFRRVLSLAPDHAAAMSALANTVVEMGDPEECEELYRKLVEAHPDDEKYAHGWLWNMAYTARADRLPDLEARKKWSARITERLAGDAYRDHPNTPDPERTLKVGYLSPDFRDFPIGYFIDPILGCHDRDAVDVTCYGSVERPDAVTERLRGYGWHWRDVLNMSDLELARAVREDGIDILVDLGGYSASSRMSSLIYRPAPIQLHGMTDPQTSGLAAVDGRLTDSVCDPEGAERFYTEKLIRLEAGFCPYRPKEEAPPVAPPPSEKKGYVTLGVTQHLGKVNARCIALWSKLMHERPDTRLLLSRNAFESQKVKKRYRDAFKAHGIEPKRLLFQGGHKTARGYLEQYGQIDIALDTFPYNGHTTTLEALWQAVPVLTFAESQLLSRTSTSFLYRLGLPELSAESDEAFVAAAAALIDDGEKRRHLRQSLRRMMADSDILNGAAFCRALESAYRELWQDWCAGRK